MENLADFPEDIRPLKSGEVQKLILAKDPVERSEFDSKNFTGNYVDEDRQIYLDKQKQFLGFVKKLKAYKQGWHTSKEYEEFMEKNKGTLFDKTENPPPETPTLGDESPREGKRERRRFVREMHQKPDPEETKENYCIEPWFKRHIILNKFIQCARGVVLRNRMLKNLEKLKELDAEKVAELEKKHVRVRNVSYAELFEKFL